MDTLLSPCKTKTQLEVASKLENMGSMSRFGKDTSPFQESNASSACMISDTQSMMSNTSSVSTRHQVDECKQLIFKALNFKKQVSANQSVKFTGSHQRVPVVLAGPELPQTKQY